MSLTLTDCILAQGNPLSETNWVDSVLNLVRTDQQMDSRTKSNLADSAFHASVREGDICKQIFARTVQASSLDEMGMADSALIQLYWANRFFHPDCDSSNLMSIFANLTNVYLSLGELNRIDSLSQIALKLWNPRWKDKDYRFIILCNLAIAQSMSGDPRGEATFRQAYREAVEDNNKVYIQRALVNLGNLKGMRGELDSAYFYFNQALAKAKETKDIRNYIGLLISFANFDKEMGNYQHANVFLDSAYVFAKDRTLSDYVAKIQNARADLYARLGIFDKAYDFLSQYVEINQQFLNEERIKAVTEMMEKYESEKKAHQIQQLKVEKLGADLNNARIKTTRNRYLYSGIGIFVLAVGLWSRLRFIRKSRSAIQHEKDISEGLLLNTLPASVANELKIKGYADATSYNVTTILFSDFKDFTETSAHLTPRELVFELNVCFRAFDEIMIRFGIEKIKTIGDAYMAAGGIPETNTATALDVVLAALEMQKYIVARKKERDAQQLTAFDMRLGIHSGPVVAGIVGIKKFQYDIWGDTVNIANRMQSSGEPGCVNISESTYQLIRDNPILSFISRGMIQVKGKGEMSMYFVKLAESTSAA